MSFKPSAPPLPEAHVVMDMEDEIEKMKKEIKEIQDQVESGKKELSTRKLRERWNVWFSSEKWRDGQKRS